MAIFQIIRKNTGGTGTGLTGQQSADLASISNKLDTATYDAYVATAPTGVQISTMQAQITANADDSPIGFTRNQDGSITVSWETQADTTLDAPVIPVLTDEQLRNIINQDAGLVSGQSLFVRELGRQGTLDHFSSIDGNELIPRPWQAKTLFDNFGNRIRFGTTSEKNALGVVPSSTPFFDTDLGKLQYYKTSSEVFTVNKAATDLPYLVEWASANSVFSNMQFKITTSATETIDNPTINLPDGQEVLLYIIGRQFFNGTLAANTLGGAFTVRNDNGVLTLVSIEPNRYWGGGLDYNTMSYTDFPNLVTSPIGISISDVNAILTNIAGAGVWTNLDGTLAQSQSLEDFKPNTAYTSGERFVAPMPANADFISNNGAIVNVDYIFEVNTDIPNTIAAFDEAQADSGNYDLVGFFRLSGAQDRVLTGTGTMILDPLSDLSSTSIGEYIHWTTTDTPKTIRLVPDPSFVTIWKDYTGNNIVQPTSANEDFVLPSDSQMWVHRVGNAIQFTFESNQGSSSETGLPDLPVNGTLILAKDEYVAVAPEGVKDPEIAGEEYIVNRETDGTADNPIPLAKWGSGNGYKILNPYKTQRPTFTYLKNEGIAVFRASSKASGFTHYYITDNSVNELKFQGFIVREYDENGGIPTLHPTATDFTMQLEKKSTYRVSYNETSTTAYIQKTIDNEALFIQHSDHLDYKPFNTLSSSNGVFSDSEAILGEGDRYYGTHAVMNQSLGKGMLLNTGEYKYCFYVKNHTTNIMNLAIDATNHNRHRIYNIATNTLSNSAFETDAGDCDLTVTNYKDLGVNGYYFEVNLRTTQNSDFRIGAYVEDAVEAWEADMIWFEKNTISTLIDVIQQDNGDGTYLEDRGIFREQWGDGASATEGTVVFSQPFASTPIITATSTQNSGHNISVLTKSATQFTFDQWDVNNTQQNGTWNWRAIGLKP